MIRSHWSYSRFKILFCLALFVGVSSLGISAAQTTTPIQPNDAGPVIPITPVGLDASLSFTHDTTQSWQGEGAYSDSPFGEKYQQILHRTSDAGGSTTYWVALRKRGGVESESAKVTMINAQSFRAGWKVRFFEGTTEKGDITSKVMGVGFPVVATSTKTIVLRFVVTAPPDAKAGDSSRVELKFTQITTSETVAYDNVQGITKVVLPPQPTPTLNPPGPRPTPTPIPRAISLPDLAVQPMPQADAPPQATNTPAPPWTGAGLIGNNGQNQTLDSVTMVGLTRRFALRLDNNSNKTQEFTLTWPAPPAGWRVELFKGLSGSMIPSGTPQTGWGPFTVEANQQILLRLEITPAEIALDSYDTLVTAHWGTKVDAIKVHSEMQRAKLIQWSNGDDKWYPISAKTPIPVKTHHILGLRVLRSNPSISWDALPIFKPTWRVKGNDFPSSYNGESIWVLYPNLGTFDFDVECGNTLSGQVSVAADK